MPLVEYRNLAYSCNVMKTKPVSSFVVAFELCGPYFPAHTGCLLKMKGVENLMFSTISSFGKLNTARGSAWDLYGLKILHTLY